MLSSRYLHLHEALGLGPMWLKRGAHVRPAGTAAPTPTSPVAVSNPPAAPAPQPAVLPPAASIPAASAHTAQAPVSAPDTPLPPQQQPANQAARTSSTDAAPCRRTSPQGAALLNDLEQRTDGHAESVPEPPAETALQAAQRLWAARTPATFPDLAQLRQQAAGCTACKLHDERKQALAGNGALPAQVLVLSLNPALHDDDTRQLFSGSHGRLLDNMLAAIGLDAASVFRTAWLRCTPRISLKPSPAEQVACAAFLEQEWAWAQPKAVLLLGDGFRDEVQQWLVKQIIGPTPCFILPHPAMLLRQPLLKAQAWPVLQALRSTLDHAPQAT